MARLRTVLRIGAAAGAVLAAVLPMPSSAFAAGHIVRSSGGSPQWVPSPFEDSCDTGVESCEENRDRDFFEKIYGKGYYVGHDEPQVQFYSNVPGSGNTSHYRLRIPTEPTAAPGTQQLDGTDTGGTYNFQLMPAFFFRMVLCDTESFPNYLPPGATEKTCTPDSDSNIYEDTDVNSDHWVGKHPGSASMELQFYPPGWVKGDTSCDLTKWCAAILITSLPTSLDKPFGPSTDCVRRAGIQNFNKAYITLNGVPQAAPGPLDSRTARNGGDPNVLQMNPGDIVTVDLYDTASGLRADVGDKTTGQSGTMTTSAANGFAHIPMKQASDTNCTQTPYDFHPMYATSSAQTRIPWSSHTGDIVVSDEIGHFEYCGQVDPTSFSCLTPAGPDLASSAEGQPAATDFDDSRCYSPASSAFIPSGQPVSGCRGDDTDFDGPAYNANWPGTNQDATQDASTHAGPIRFTSPTFDSASGPQTYAQVNFEANLPSIEACNVATGAGCTNPPPGAAFYPIYTTTNSQTQLGACSWQFGGALLANTIDNFGGTSATEYRDLTATNGAALTEYNSQPTTVKRYTDFTRVESNTCQAK